MAWPELREELALLDGPRLPDGQPSWTLHDPMRNRFFSLDWPSFEMLRRWSYADPDAIVASVTTDTVLQLGVDDVQTFARFLVENQLVQPAGEGSAKQLAERLKKMEGSAMQWLLHHYLYFRVPLWKPDAWLGRWQAVAGLFYTRGFWLLTLLALCLGLFQVARQWDGFVATMVDTLTWSGLASYGVALFAVKGLHELGHAFTAKRFGCRVPAMGIAFLVMFPMAYTDTNDTWQLTSHRRRLQVASAGIITELMIAAWATLAWALLPDGALRSSVFFLATTSWIATLAINASPFMRFDGYFILADWLHLPNLHERSFALARWKLREWLFDLGEEKPEHFSANQQRALIVFAWITWLYRLTVFIGIAVLVYQFFFKLLGIFLFAVEVFWFIALPLRHELAEWKKRWPKIRRSARSRRTALMLLALILLLAAPWPGRVYVRGMLRPAEVYPVFTPGPSRLTGRPPIEGAAVKTGDTLFEFESPQLHTQRATLLARLESARWQAATAGFDVESRAHLLSSQQALEALTAELAGLDAAAGHYVVKAPFNGVLRDIDPELAMGQWVASREPLAILIGDSNKAVVETYLSEEAVRSVSVGNSALFIPHGREGKSVRLSVARIDPDASRALSNGVLSAPAGGHILVREKNSQLVPEVPHYRVVLEPLSDDALNIQRSVRGDIVLHTQWQSPLLPYWRSAMSVMVREFGF